MRGFLIVLTALMAAYPAWGQIAPLKRTVGFLMIETSGQPSPEAAAAGEAAGRLAEARTILVNESGGFTDEHGETVALNLFQTIWLHQGDSVGGLASTQVVESLKRYVEHGNGLFLSGAALALVHSMGIEPARPRIVATNTAPGLFPLHTLEEGHPIFQGLLVGLPWDESVGGFTREFDLPFTGAGLAAYADFAGSGGPRQGRLLAWADEPGANPLVEYAAGKGRVIAFGGRSPSYTASRSDRSVGSNILHQLTKNILSYLGDSAQWQPVTRPVAAEVVGLPTAQVEACERALRDLTATFGPRYANGPLYLRRLEALKSTDTALAADGGAKAQAARQSVTTRFQALRSEALLANPLLDFDRLLLVQRGEGQMGLPANFNANTELPTTGYDNQVVVLSPVHPDGALTPLYRPDNGKFVGDLDLHFNGDRMLLSMPGTNGRWQVFELKIDGSQPRQLPLIEQPDVDNYDACYLPDGRVVFSSTACFAGVPCVAGSSHVANLYLLERDGSIRQLTVDQDHDWCPTVANSGRVMYLRWEYTDLPHANSRRLFEMNPDGTGQMAIFGSSSYFPPSFFYARPIPGHPSKIVGIATGHHGISRSGRLLIVDPALGSREAEGVVQEIPGWGRKVEPIVRDILADGVWPQFLHPFPLSEKYYLVSAKPHANALWGLYLVDVFDNLVLLKELSGYAMLEPIPLRKTVAPPVVQDHVDTRSKEAKVYLSDIYVGGGLRGIPRGSVKRLRLYTYNYSGRGFGGLLGAVGMDGPWDIRRVLGTVPVEADGSAYFRVPANTPIALQPLDQKGQAMQLMRSWFTAMPGETVSCVGCHEQLRDASPNRKTLAARRVPSAIQSWRGPARGFAFARELQPVLDRHCVACHQGAGGGRDVSQVDLHGDRLLTNWWTGFAGNVGTKDGGKFSVAYAELQRFVRRPGIESDIHLLTPMEFHADTTELVQLLRKGHHGVNLDPVSWDRLTTWIDLNAPYHGTWTEIFGESRVKPVFERRSEMSRQFAGVDVDQEVVPETSSTTCEPVQPAPSTPISVGDQQAAGWPFDADEARRRQSRAGPVSTMTVELAPGVKLDFVLIPPGEFLMGDTHGEADEQPLTRVRIAKPFWMSRTEIGNEQFAQFDPGHDSHFEPMHAYQFGIHGFPVNKPRQPVVRVSWRQAMGFCQWLGERAGRRFNLPTEAQWEYACRAGTATPLWYGDLNTDFSAFANLGDLRLRDFALETYIRVRPIASPSPYDDWVPKDDRFDDGAFVTAEIGRYRPNPWGLCDMHGNVWEWTRTSFRPYPYHDEDGRNSLSGEDPRVVRGGSWYDRPKRGRSSYRLSYPPYQRVFNVGFRVVVETEP